MTVTIKPGGQVSQEEMMAVEAELGYPLPPAYREFLARTDGGEFAEMHAAISYQRVRRTPRTSHHSVCRSHSDDHNCCISL